MKAAPILETDETWAVLRQALQEARGTDSVLEGWTSDAQFTEHGKKRVVRYDLNVRAVGVPHIEHYQWVGKYYEFEELAHLVASVLKSIGQNEFARAAGLVVSTVLAYHPTRHLLFLSYESGEPVTSAIAGETELILATMGRALAALHEIPIKPPSTTSPSTVLAELRMRVADLTSWLPERESDLREAFAQLEDQAPKFSRISFVHNDFGPANLLWRDGKVVVLDFDKCAQGDPAVDLGNFLVQLRRRVILHPDRFREFPPARRALLDAYARWSCTDPGLEDRVAWYERATLLRKVHRLWLQGRTEGSEEGTRHIADAQRLLRVFLEDSEQHARRSPDNARELPDLALESEALGGQGAKGS